MVPPSTTHKRPPSDMFDEIVSIKVGSDSTSKMFQIHKGVLSFYSGFFQAAFNGQFNEAKDGLVHLKEENPDTFSAFVVWVYKGWLEVPQESSSMDTYAYIINLWVLADMLDVPLLRNQIVDAMRDFLSDGFRVSPLYLTDVYAATTKSSGLRRLYIWALARCSRDDEFEDIEINNELYKWPAEAIWDLLRIRWKVEPCLEPEQLKDIDMCTYHDHADLDRCNRGKHSCDKRDVKLDATETLEGTPCYNTTTSPFMTSPFLPTPPTAFPFNPYVSDDGANSQLP